MVDMPEKVIENIKAMKTVVFATVSENGLPNAVPVASIMIRDPSTILIGDNFFKKTADNLKKADSNVAICSWVGREGYQIKGVANYKTEGADYESMKKMIKNISEKLPAKGCAVMKVTEVYDVAPGPNAGNRVV